MKKAFEKRDAGRRGNVDKKRLFHMLRQGRSQVECAKEFNVTPSAISQHVKTLNLAVASNTNLETGSQIVEESLDAMSQLRKVNKQTNKLIDLLAGWVEGDPAAIKKIERQHRLMRIGSKKGAVNAVSAKDPRELLLKSIQEVRSQLRLSLDIAESLHNMKAVQEFQQTVIEIIGQQNPEARNAIIRKLQERRALRGSLRLTGRS